MLLRTLIQFALGVFGNIWVALAAGGLVASVICFPTLFAGIVRSMKTRLNDEGEHSPSEIGAMFGVSRQTVYRVVADK